MFDEKALAKIMKTYTGCISPFGELIACESYDHFKIMEVQEYYDEIHSEYWQEADEIQKNPE